MTHYHTEFRKGGNVYLLLRNVMPGQGNFVLTTRRIRDVCVGIHEAYQALTTDQQLAGRFGEFELPQWRNDASFARLLKNIRGDVSFAGCLRPLRT